MLFGTNVAYALMCVTLLEQSLGPWQALLSKGTRRLEFVDLSCLLNLDRALELIKATEPKRPSGQRRQRPDSDSFGNARTHRGPKCLEACGLGHGEFEPQAATLL